MLTPVFSFVCTATGYQKCLSSDRAVIITLVCVQDALKWLNWFREITSLMLQRKNVMLGKLVISSTAMLRIVFVILDICMRHLSL